MHLLLVVSCYSNALVLSRDAQRLLPVYYLRPTEAALALLVSISVMSSSKSGVSPVNTVSGRDCPRLTLAAMSQKTIRW